MTVAPPRQRLDAVLVGFQDQGNLGMGYLAATLAQHGRSVEMLEVRDPDGDLVERIREADPFVVGFSLIFQFYLPGYRELAAALRAARVSKPFHDGRPLPEPLPRRGARERPRARQRRAASRASSRCSTWSTRVAAGDDWRDVPGLAYRRRRRGSSRPSHGR